MDVQEVDEFIEHFGVKGMRWGVRRGSKDSKSDGSDEKLTGRANALTRGRGKKKGLRKDPDSEDTAVKKNLQQKVKQNKSTDPLSNTELRKLNERLQLEQTYSQLMAKERANAPKSPAAKGAAWAANMTGQIANQAVKNVASNIVTAQIQNALPSELTKKK